MGNVKMANITINNSTMLLRFLFSTAKHMSSKGTNFNYEYETSRACTRYHRRPWNSLVKGELKTPILDSVTVLYFFEATVPNS